ncbi:hypothetical protein [Prosthecomicrobium sp. N25]|uniref:hypothetical protein n=1 Tax=Prosthecomicrobium sp. N25 TaxID=3129254 RepID=UPI0030778CC0
MRSLVSRVGGVLLLGVGLSGTAQAESIISPLPGPPLPASVARASAPVLPVRVAAQTPAPRACTTMMCGSFIVINGY